MDSPDRSSSVARFVSPGPGPAPAEPASGTGSPPHPQTWRTATARKTARRILLSGLGRGLPGSVPGVSLRPVDEHDEAGDDENQGSQHEKDAHGDPPADLAG